MDLNEIAPVRGGILNFFQGATIHNIVINGNMEKHGTDNYYSGGKESKPERPKCTDQQIAHALMTINGKEKVLNSYQGWLGACCLLMGKYGYPKNLEMCCTKISSLFQDGELEYACKYDNIRKFTFLKFVNTDVDTWDSYEPKADEKRLFAGCHAVMKQLDAVLKESES